MHRIYNPKNRNTYEQISTIFREKDIQSQSAPKAANLQQGKGNHPLCTRNSHLQPIAHGESKVRHPPQQFKAI